jgi:hypothetical protein
MCYSRWEAAQLLHHPDILLLLLKQLGVAVKDTGITLPVWPPEAEVALMPKAALLQLSLELLYIMLPATPVVIVG